MSHFFQLSSLALIWRKLEQVWQWGRNWVISRRLTKKSIDVQSSQFQPNYRRRFVLNLLVDLGILGLAFLFRDSAFLKGIENEGIDTLMQIRQKIIPANPDIPAFVSLDIDDKTHQAWNTPMFTPHDRLLNLIKTAVNAEASLVIIDVDLSRETSLKGLEKYTQGLAHHPYDQALSDFLGSYKASCVHKTVCPTIILARVFQSSTECPYCTRSSFLDETVKKYTPYVQWASTLFFGDFYEHNVRHWWLWQSACTDAEPTVIPSMELLAASLIRNGLSQSVGLAKELQPF